MYGWITIGEKKAYRSAIFARKIRKGNWGKYEKGYHEYCLVLNEDKTKLISIDTYQNNNLGIEVHVLPIITDLEEWQPKNYYYGCMPFLKDLDLETLPETITPDLLKKCVDIDQHYEANYQEVAEAKNKQDVINLLESCSEFDDAHVLKVEKKDDQLHVIFDKAWGSQLELWFKGTPDYHLSENYDEYWWDSGSIFWEDGNICLCDEYGIKSLKDDNYSCYFKGKKLFYHVKPVLMA